MVKERITRSIGLFFIVWFIFFSPLVFNCLAEEEQIEDTVFLEEDTQEEAQNTATELQAIAGEDKSVAVSRKIVFDASKSVVDSEKETQYLWDFGDTSEAEGVDVLHVYDKPGYYHVTLTVKNGDKQKTDELIVAVYEDLIVLLADKEVDQEKIVALSSYAERQNVLLTTVTNVRSGTESVVEESLLKGLIEANEDVKKADIIISWTSSANIGLNVLSSFGVQTEDSPGIDFSRKGIVVITDKNLSTVARIAQSTFDVLGPELIILTKPAALEAVIDARVSENVVSEVYRTGVENVQIGIHSERAVEKLGITNFLSYTINFLINNGVSTENVTLLLLLPVIATIIAFVRQVLGVKMLGIYIPSLLSLTFVATGIKYGLFIFIVLLAVATLLRLLLKKTKIQYLPRMAIVLTVTAFAILTLFVVGSLTKRTGIIELSIFPILILVILVERFIEVQIEKGFKDALRLSFETIVVSIACYFLINWESLKTFIIAYPEVILLTVVINIIVGKWVGLRLSEYFRFREISKFIKERGEK
ncbi:PKD domain-containing protein [Patescibacteria group bacterium]|nr:PKD domain-containing protein [Patescibacteria group bacterium]